MSAPSAEVIRLGQERARAGRWRGDQRVAFLAPLPAAPLPSAAFVQWCLATLKDQGYTRVVTSALSPFEQTGFLAAGFAIEERLHLLAIDLVPALPALPDGRQLARAGRRRLDGVLRVDHDAFAPFWRFDAASVGDAVAATPSTRFRVALDAGEVVGYAICGRAGSRGFVQRLAVAATERGTGTGRRLLLDGLHWMRRHGVSRAVVNTQVDNAGALRLYHRVGFVDEPGGLCVLAAGLS